ncbi:hypothetical protein DQD29_22540, partial [Salmonella enterica subsp. salamae]|nr:hypothetical protein [Salmonella enterica subsp. salamae]
EDAENPNVGKDLTDEEKNELGGAGSGSPNGWGPQDEENARNQEKMQDVLDAADRLGVDLDSINIHDGIAEVDIDLTNNISYSDIRTLLDYAKSQGATEVEVNSGYLANEKLMEVLTKRMESGKNFYGGEIIKNTSGTGDFTIVFK